MFLSIRFEGVEGIETVHFYLFWLLVFLRDGSFENHKVETFF